MSGRTRKPYPTDRTDDRWERVQPPPPSPKSGTPAGGRPAAHTRAVVDAVFDRLRGGPVWRILPHGLPSGEPVDTRLRLWRPAGVWDRVHATPREEVRVAAGAPATVWGDGRTAATTHRGGPRGYDGRKNGERSRAARGR